MLMLTLLIIPVAGIIIVSLCNLDKNYLKQIGLLTSILNLFICLVIFINFDYVNNQFQFIQEYHYLSYYDFYLGIDGLSIYFILLTCIIIPISLLSN